MEAALWLEGARPRTLSASVVPVLVGPAASHELIAWRLAVALIVALAIQVGVNFANDYFDALKGVDTVARVGPRRIVASGAVTPGAMRLAIAVAFLIAALAGVALAAAAGWGLLALGAASLAAALAYSGGPRPYASLGLGEVAVFIFFGVVATTGSAFVQTGRIEPAALAASVPVGLLVTAILVTNNLRDVDTDRAAGKTTLAVRLGPARTRRLYSVLVVGAFVSLPLVGLVAGVGAWTLIALLAAPLAGRPLRLVAADSDPPRQLEALVKTSRLHLVFGVLLALGLWI